MTTTDAPTNTIEEMHDLMGGAYDLIRRVERELSGLLVLARKPGVTDEEWRRAERRAALAHKVAHEANMLRDLLRWEEIKGREAAGLPYRTEE